jgi:hypothetical protein
MLNAVGGGGLYAKRIANSRRFECYYLLLVQAMARAKFRESAMKTERVMLWQIDR